MTTIVITVAVVTALTAGAAGALAWARTRFTPRDPDAIDRIEALLPQTQCAQCGYPGCRPYAEAIAGGAGLDLCPPGGADTQAALAKLLGRDAGHPVTRPEPVVALIDEAACIGCFLCVQACPVDAIVGAPQLMHTVLSEACTGCELCVAPCPVDCISLVPTFETPLRQPPPAPEGAACIRCNRCVDVCPVHLAPQNLYRHGAAGRWGDADAAELAACIECGLCDRACPSGLPLAATFGAGRSWLAEQARETDRAADARTRHEQRQRRLAARAAARDRRRTARLLARRSP